MSENLHCGCLVPSQTLLGIHCRQWFPTQPCWVMVTGAAWLWDGGGIGWRIQEMLGWEEAPWTMEINGRSRKQQHWEVWEAPAGTVAVGSCLWVWGVLGVPTEGTTVMLSDVPNPAELEQPLGGGSLGKSPHRQSLGARGMCWCQSLCHSCWHC